MDASKLGQGTRLFAEFAATCKSISLYGTTHPFVQEQGVKVVALLDALLDADTAELSFHLFEDELFLERDFLPDATLRFAKTISAFLCLGIGSVTLKRGLTPEETIEVLSRLVDAIVSSSSSPGDSSPPAQGFLGSEHLVTGSLSLRPAGLAGSEPEAAKASELHSGRHLYDLAVRASDSAVDAVRRGGLPDMPAISRAVGSMVQSILQDETALLGLTALKQHNEYTAYHSVNVAILSACFAARLGLGPDEISAIARGAMLHDLGKVSLGAPLIEKKSALDADEWAEMRRHPEEGVKLLCGLSELDDAAVTITYQHHLCFDLSGYPTGYRGGTQHVFAAIVQLADVYDGITSERSYHAARTPHRALKLITGKAGTLFHPSLAREFAHMIGVYPIGSKVLLSDGAQVIVADHNPDDPLRPLISAQGGRSSKDGSARLEPAPAQVVDFAS